MYPFLRMQAAGGLMLLVMLAQNTSQASDWPMFRGPNGSSVANSDHPPLEWSVSEGKNLAWQADLPGRGVSGPIVVGKKLFLTASSGPNRSRLHVLAFDTNSGKKLWHRQFWATGRTLCHETSAVAAPTPASDGSRVFAYFSSNDIIALDSEGNLLWMRGLALDFPGAGNDIGFSSSPVVVENVVVIQSEAQGNSFVAALDTHDGSMRWSLKRPQRPNWSSPIAMSEERDGRQVSNVVLQSGQSLSAHHADTGKVLWALELDCDTISSSVFDGLLYVPAGGLKVFDVANNPANNSLVWQESKLKPGSSSPVVDGNEIFVVNGAGVLTCGSLKSKRVVWRQRLGGRFWATPVVAGNHIYCINSEGKCFVVKRGKRGRVVSENEFGEDILASPAISDNALYVRSHQHLWKIAN